MDLKTEKIHMDVDMEVDVDMDVNVFVDMDLSKIAGCAACAPMYHSQPCAVFGWHSLYHPEAHRLPQ
jgi:hypothetical protein